MKETQITAYALNELQGDERDKFESDLASDQGLQAELQSASRVADGLAQVMTEPGEGLAAPAREKLLRAIVENQKAFRQRRKIIRLSVPVSLAAAASIAVLLWVSGGKTAQGPAVAAADGAGVAETQPSAGVEADGGGVADSFQVRGIPGPPLATRTISMSESARVAQELRADAGLSLTSPAVRMKPLIWDDELARWGSLDHDRP